MTKPLIPLTVQSPGFLGLNTQQSGNVLPVGWATKLENFIWDDVGRIASRKGTQQVGTTVATGSPAFKAIHEYVDASNNKVNILAGGNKIWKEVSGTYTDITGTATTPTGDDWQFVNFNGWCVGFQVGHNPIIAVSATTPVFADMGGTARQGEMGLSAYGRLWTVVTNTLYYSDLLVADMTDLTGSSGNFDLAKFWPNGMDEAVALVDFNGLLIVFGQDSIIVYQNADDVDNMTIVEGISGLGCIARDSVQVIGKDVIFLSDSGVRSLGRSLSDEAMPMTDLSFHVREELMAMAIAETSVEICSVYDAIDGFYLLSLPTTGTSWYFDLKFPNEDGSLKAATWDYAPDALMESQDHTTYISRTAGFISTLTGYAEEALSVGTGGSSYAIDYEGVWNDFGQEVSPLKKILKTVNLLASGTTSSSVAFKWAVDYESTFHTLNLSFNTSPPAAYGTAQYDVDVFAASGVFERVRKPLSNNGQVILMGLTTTIDGTSFAIQRIDVLAKIGKIGI